MSNIPNPNQDELDRMLQTEDQETPGGSQTPKNTESHSEQGGQEEVEFNQLTGPAQDRFKRMITERNDWMNEAKRLKEIGLQTPPTPPTNTYTPDVKEAVNKLRNVGIATVEDVETRIQDILARRSFTEELSRLEGELAGTDGRPKFVREDYQDYISRHPQYQSYLPKDVYNIMYEEEISDWKLQNKGRTPTRQSATLKPTRTNQREESLTPEDIENKLKSLPDDQKVIWYEKNKEKIEAAMKQQ